MKLGASRCDLGLDKFHKTIREQYGCVLGARSRTRTGIECDIAALEAVKEF
ncbi:hypothetical protein FTUN_1962 [Frigoriglobus tundricola]|uniref:Uncharacterized protein n=1 Tax=Frigoriglobus tundricola TaxID=2774151 RepID=A0A6M5YNA7_9BACT|nr:hypothetical protein FTUN_1962 [Frigoriglobus tundricola]